MSDKLTILLTSKSGVTLYTKGKYCNRDIVVVPQLEGINSGETAIISNGKTVLIEKANVIAYGDNSISIGG